MAVINEKPSIPGVTWTEFLEKFTEAVGAFSREYGDKIFPPPCPAEMERSFKFDGIKIPLSGAEPVVKPKYHLVRVQICCDAYDLYHRPRTIWQWLNRLYLRRKYRKVDALIKRLQSKSLDGFSVSKVIFDELYDQPRRLSTNGQGITVFIDQERLSYRNFSRRRKRRTAPK